MTPALRAHFVEQAGFCDALGSPFTARLIEAMGHDLTAGGPTADLVGDWAGPPRADAVALRLAGALHAAALSGRAPALAAHYPAARPDWDAAAVWSAARAVLERERAWIAGFLHHTPQTNEPRRSIALLAGFLHLAATVDLPLALLEIGASAGLNLYWDRYAYRTAAWTWGAPDGVPIDTRWTGPAPPLGVVPRVRSRAACDQHPLDVRDAADRLRLRAYVWADQADRLARLDAAVAVAVAQTCASSGPTPPSGSRPGSRIARRTRSRWCTIRSSSSTRRVRPVRASKRPSRAPGTRGAPPWRGSGSSRKRCWAARPTACGSWST
jgi:hypothetical protein